MEQFRSFNNGAIPILEAGYLEEAKDVLRAALETKKAHDRGELTGCSNSAVRRCVTPECIFVAEHHLINQSTYTSRPREIPGNLASLSTGGFLIVTSGSSPNLPSPTPTMHLFARAFAIEEEDDGRGNDDPGDSHYSSAVNVFNLGLVHQLQDPYSTKARGLYEVSASMLSLNTWDEHSALLRAAVTNNFAVWTYQNGQLGASRAAFLELGRMVVAWPGDPEHAAGFQSNLRILEFLQGTEEEEEEEEEEEDETGDEDNNLRGIFETDEAED